jgi:hypothetical protein
MIKQMKKGKHTGTWQVRIQPINKVTGKRESWPVTYVKTHRMAIALERQMWADYEEGLNLGDGNAVFADEFLKYVQKKKKVLSPVTYKSWEYSAAIFSQYFHKAKIKNMVDYRMKLATQLVVNKKRHSA